MKRLATVFTLGSLACEFQMVYILLSVGGSTIIFYSPELMEKIQKNRIKWLVGCIFLTFVAKKI